MCKVIAVANQKGGVGKSSVVANLGAGLVREGKKVCCIDADPQGNLTISLGYPDPDELPVTLATIMTNIVEEKDFPSDYGMLHHQEGIELIPANMELSGIEVSLANTMSREMILKEYIDMLRDRFDWILIDTIADYQALSNQLIGKAEEFRRALNEVENRVLNYEEFQREYKGWIQNVRTLYFKLSDMPPASLTSSRWSEAVMNLAGWVVDLAVLLELKRNWVDPGERWIILQTIRRYEQALETLGRIERMSTSIKIEREDVLD